MKHSLAFTALALGVSAACAAPAEPFVNTPPAAPTAAAAAVPPAARLFSEGMTQLQARNWRDAQAKFEAVLSADHRNAEAHNNLAYVLRMQGPQNFGASLTHYNRAIELKPGLAQAYMYRGVLFVQQGDTARARADLTALRLLDRGLANDLERVAMAAEGQGGVAFQSPY